MIPLWDDETEARVRAAARSLDKQTTPDTVRMCTKCVVTNQRPRITFDEHGVCSACRYAEDKWNGGIDWSEREGQLQKLLSRFRTQSGYNVIVPCSAGKDSSHVATSLRDAGMNPLCALWEPFMYTDIGRANVDAFCHGGFDLVKAQPNGMLHRKLARLALEFKGDPFEPFVYGQLAWPLHVAVHNGCRLVFYGENGEAEYGGDTSANNRPFWSMDDWERVYLKGAGYRDIVAIGKDLGVFGKGEIERATRYYEPPPRRVMEELDIQVHWFGYYRPWHPQQNFYEASERTGFQTEGRRSEMTYTKFASIDDKMDGIHYRFAYLKFGIGRCTSDAAQQVRAGDIDRDEALALVQRYDHEIPERHMAECLEYLGMDREQYDMVEMRFSGKAEKAA